jgi:hypothetical protein
MINIGNDICERSIIFIAHIHNVIKKVLNNTLKVNILQILKGLTSTSA